MTVGICSVDSYRNRVISFYLRGYAETYSSKFDYVRLSYVTFLYGGIIVGTGFTIKVAAGAQKEIIFGAEVPTKDEDDEKANENKEKTEKKVWSNSHTANM